MSGVFNLGLVITFLSFSVCGAISQVGKNSDLDSILGRFPGYHLQAVQELDSAARDFFLRHFPRQDPGIVRGDFNGDGNPDYALLLKGNKSTAQKLVVFLCSGVGQCKSVYDLDVTAYSDSVYLRPVKVGSRVSQTDAIPRNDRALTKKPMALGIEITYFEKAKVVLSWNPKLKKLDEMQTED